MQQDSSAKIKLTPQAKMPQGTQVNFRSKVDPRSKVDECYMKRDLNENLSANEVYYTAQVRSRSYHPMFYTERL